jgi:hypothetical protein
MKIDNKNGVVIYDPEVLLWGVATGFHGYAVAFINNYATCIYAKGLKRRLKYRKSLWQLGVKRYIPFVNSLEKANKTCSSLVGFVVPAKEDHELQSFHGTTFFHLMDYYLFVTRNMNFLKKYKIDYVIGHTQMDKNCAFFNEFYPSYQGKVVSLPFGYAKRFCCTKAFEERKNIAIGLGSINPVDDPQLAQEAKEQFVKYFSNQDFMHPLRRYLQMHEKEYADVVEARFPDAKKQKDFSYDAVQVLNDYRMFINDAGLSHFPPARTFEGIACGCVMIAEDDVIYKELGFEPDVNYIAFEKGNYQQMHDKIKYYIENEKKLKKIQEKSVELAKKYAHEGVSKMLMNEIVRRSRQDK